MKTAFLSSIIRSMLLIVIVLSIEIFTEPGVSAQGIYSRNKAASETETGNKGDDSNHNNNQSDGSLFRAGGTMGGANQTKVSPLKDGWEILLIAGISYGFCIARRKRTKS